MTQIHIRDATSDDLEALTSLLAELFSLEADFKADKQTQKRGLMLMLDGCGKHRCIKVAVAAEKVVGMCTIQLLISTAEGGMAGLVEDMVVSRDFRGRGIGALLMHHIENWAKEHGASRLQLLADRTNEPALTFYKNNDWQFTQLIGLRKKWDKKIL